MSVIDANNCIAGRLASSVAKRLLKGESIFIINAEKAVISGDSEASYQFFKQRVERGDPYHGPFYPKQADMMLRRIIRGMLPFHKPRGREAYRRLSVFLSVPENLKKEKAEVLEKAISKLDSKFTTVGSISRKLGAKGV